MNLPDTVRIYLDQQRLPYRLLPCPPHATFGQTAKKLDLPLRRIARAVLLKDTDGLIMAILPYSHILDFLILGELLQRKLEPLDSAEAMHFFQGRGCQADSRPPLPAAFDLHALVDTSLDINNAGEIYFEGGGGDTFVAMQSSHFGKLLGQARWARFAIPMNDLDFLGGQQAPTPQDLASLANRYTPTQSHTGIESIAELPAIPQTIRDILALRADPNTRVQDVIQIIERDTRLAAQLVYWSRAPLHGYHDRTVDSLEITIQHVLGMETTLDLLLGFSMGQAFRIPLDGPVGLQAVWRHSIYCAALIGELVKILPNPMDIKPGLAYLCGLLHDFGYLVIGHVLPARFFLLNRFLAVNRHVAFHAVERYVMGTEHWHIGAWLMQSWNMPGEVIASVRWHHSEESIQQYAEYANLVLIANRLLHYVGFGEEHNNRLPALAMFMLGITPDQTMIALRQVQSSMAELDNLCAVLPLPPET